MNKSRIFSAGSFLLAILAINAVAAYQYTDYTTYDSQYTKVSSSQSNCNNCAQYYIEEPSSIQRNFHYIPYYVFSPRAYHYQTSSYTDLYSSSMTYKAQTGSKVYYYNYDQGYQKAQTGFSLYNDASIIYYR
ncbi:MAG: hypothetical protein Q7S74_03280 [Nanoarchaeota archaeon]|nr:hypothetical protein [Nanoarchaeota archaeon]